MVDQRRIPAEAGRAARQAVAGSAAGRAVGTGFFGVGLPDHRDARREAGFADLPGKRRSPSRASTAHHQWRWGDMVRELFATGRWSDQRVGQLVVQQGSNWNACVGHGE